MIEKRNRIPGSLVIASVLVLTGTFATAITAAAQDFEDLQTPTAPLVLRAQGSFYVGGTLFDVPNCPGGDACPIMADQMYVRYMIPQTGGPNNTPVVMIGGAGLTGKLYETTPDGRMGWDEYFVRRHHASYVVDPPWRGRSGFNYTPFNQGNTPFMIPISAPSPERAWVSFRFGPEFGVPYDDTQFPVEAIDELAKQGFPLFSVPPTGFFPHNFNVLSELATKLEGAVLMGHSFSGFWPLNAALLDPTVVKGIINVDGCPGAGAPPEPEDGDDPLAALVNIPMLGVIGDHNEESNRPGPESCTAFIDRFTALGGNAEVIFLPDMGIFGNSHLMMMDKNNLQIAGMMLKWIHENVDRKKKKK